MAKTKLYKWKNGEKVALTSREIKAYIMKVNKWTSAEYKKKYDIFKNKLRAYEAFEKHQTGNVKKQSAVELLYKQAKAKTQAKAEGVKYKPSIKMKRIESFTSISSGKAGQKALQSEKYIERRSQTYSDATYQQFKGLIENNAKAEEIYKKIKDPVKREQALTAYANELKLKVKEDDERVQNEAIPYGETMGSDESIDFDYSSYL